MKLPDMKQSKELDSILPLTEATFYILISLAPQPMHGYAIMKYVRKISSGRVTFSTGTLYGALKRLLEQGWISRIDPPDDKNTESRRPRKEYELTCYGRTILNAEIARIKELARLAGSVRTWEVKP